MFQHFKFRINDKVFFKEQQGHIYRVVGYRIEKSFYPQENWTTIIYELYREFDGLVADAEEEELILAQNRKVELEDIDALLDKYNDFGFLAAFFQDTVYNQKRLEVLEEIKDIGTGL